LSILALAKRQAGEQPIRVAKEERMKYIFLAYNDEALLALLPPSEHAALGNACFVNNAALRANGHLITVEGLQNSDTATTVRIQNGKIVLADGPYAKTQEQLSGLFIIDARDLNEAIQIAAQMPQVRGGSIEIRPAIE
jgi:hypothetical protein